MDTLGNNPTIETLAPGLTVEWLENRHLLVYTMKSLTRATMNVWMAHSKKTLLEWPADRPYLVIQDVSDKDLGMPPFIRQQSTELSKLRPDLPGAVALILPDRFFYQLIAAYLRVQRKDEREIKVFFTREEALSWLRGKM